MSWGSELWDQFDTLSFHTQKGIEFLERYAHFIRDRCSIEMEYAAKLRRLVKGYQPKKKEEEDYQYTSCKAFRRMMSEVTDLAGQHEVIAENLHSEVIREVSIFVKDVKEDRKRCLQDGTRYMALLTSQMSSLERSKKNYEKAFKETEKALENFQRADADLNLSRAEVEKQRMNLAIKSQHYEESKNEYANQLQKTNDLQRQHYYTSMPEVFRQLQELDERRTRSIKSFMIRSTEVERKVFPIINKCLDEIVNAANDIDEKEDTAMVVERYKSGFQPPEDIPFLDLHVESDNSSTTNSSNSKLALSSSGSRTGLSSNSSSANHNGIRTDIRTVKGTITSSKLRKRGVLLGIFGSNKDDFADLPPNQRKKKLQQRLDEINAKIQQETATRDGLMKMKSVYEENPALGDPMSIEGELNESGHKLDKLRNELQKYQGYLDETEKNSPSAARKSSTLPSSSSSSALNGSCAQKSALYHNSNREDVTDSPNKSISICSNNKIGTVSRDEDPLSRSVSETNMATSEDGVSKQNSGSNLHNQRTNHIGSSHGPESGIGTSQTSLPDSDVIEYYDPPALGTCKALYPFEATSEGSIPMYDGEELYIIELDQGDGWTRVRRQTDHEEGFVPTSYIECTVFNC